MILDVLMTGTCILKKQSLRGFLFFSLAASKCTRRRWPTLHLVGPFWMSCLIPKPDSDFPLASPVFEALDTGCQVEPWGEEQSVLKEFALHMHYVYVWRDLSLSQLLFKTAATPLAMLGAAFYQQATVQVFANKSPLSAWVLTGYTFFVT